MKARVFKTESQIRRIVKEEATQQTTKIYEAALRDATYQAHAVMMCVLHREFGFGEERLRRLKDLTESEYMAMRVGALGKPYTTNDCVKFLKEEYGIDFAESQYDESWDNVTTRRKR